VTFVSKIFTVPKCRDRNREIQFSKVDFPAPWADSPKHSALIISNEMPRMAPPGFFPSSYRLAVADSAGEQSLEFYPTFVGSMPSLFARSSPRRVSSVSPFVKTNPVPDHRSLKLRLMPKSRSTTGRMGLTLYYQVGFFVSRWSARHSETITSARVLPPHPQIAGSIDSVRRRFGFEIFRRVSCPNYRLPGWARGKNSAVPYKALSRAVEKFEL